MPVLCTWNPIRIGLPLGCANDVPGSSAAPASPPSVPSVRRLEKLLRSSDMSVLLWMTRHYSARARRSAHLEYQLAAQMPAFAYRVGCGGLGQFVGLDLGNSQRTTG